MSPIYLVSSFLHKAPPNDDGMKTVMHVNAVGLLIEERWEVTKEELAEEQRPKSVCLSNDGRTEGRVKDEIRDRR